MKTWHAIKKTSFDVFHILHESSQLRMFLNSKDQVYVELSNKDDAVGIALTADEARELYRKLESLILKIPIE